MEEKILNEKSQSKVEVEETFKKLIISAKREIKDEMEDCLSLSHYLCYDHKDRVITRILHGLNTAENQWELHLYPFLKEHTKDFTFQEFMNNIGCFLITLKDLLDNQGYVSERVQDKLPGYNGRESWYSLNIHNISSFHSWFFEIVLTSLPELLVEYKEFNSLCLIMSAITPELYDKHKYMQDLEGMAKRIKKDYRFELESETMPFVRSVIDTLTFKNNIKYKDHSDIMEYYYSKKFGAMIITNIGFVDQYIINKYRYDNLGSIQQLQYNMIKIYGIKQSRREENLRINYEKLIAGSRIECKDSIFTNEIIDM